MNSPPPRPSIRKGLGLASAREQQRPTPQPSAMLDIPRHYLFISAAPIVVLFLVAIVLGWLGRRRGVNEMRKEGFLDALGEGFEARPRARQGTGTKGPVGLDDDKDGLRRRNVRPAAGIKAENEEDPKKKGKKPIMDRPLIVGFWHPYCNAGGGGERVLWTAIYWAIKNDLTRADVKMGGSGNERGTGKSSGGESGRGRGKGLVCVVYTGDYPDVGKEEILGRVFDRFHLPLNDPQFSSSIHFLPLPSRRMIGDGYWKRFTLLGQSVGSLWVAGEGMGCWGRGGVEGGTKGFWPDVFIDTMGHPFTLPLVSILSAGQVPTGAYVHYPVISTDMIGRVKTGVKGVESGGDGTNTSGWKKLGKVLYYQLFTRLVAISLLFADEIMTNSSWTSAHVTSLLTLGRSTWLAYLLNLDGSAAAGKRVTPNRTVFPPCGTSEFANLPLKGRDDRPRTLISLAQFRPEKDQAKQIRAVAELFEKAPKWREEGVRLVLMGSCRDAADEERIEGLRRLAKELGVENSVEFVVNASFPEIVSRLGQASIGLNTMMDEHFGISVVEFMAAGLVPLVHVSAGPLLDIVVPLENGQITGFHATTASSFATQLDHILSLSAAESLKIRKAAREQATIKFSQSVFTKGWGVSWEGLLNLALRGKEERRLDDEAHERAQA